MLDSIKYPLLVDLDGLGMNPRLIILIIVTAILAAYRLLPHPPNVTPVAAMALFAGAHFSSKRLAFVVPLLALLLSDLVLGFYPGIVFVYAAFALTVLLGTRLQWYRAALSVPAAALVSAVVFFLMANFGAWLSLDIYPKTFDGLMAAYTAAIPFFRNTLIGDIGFTLLLFGGFRLAEQRLPALRPGPDPIHN